MRLSSGCSGSFRTSNDWLALDSVCEFWRTIARFSVVKGGAFGPSTPVAIPFQTSKMAESSSLWLERNQPLAIARPASCRSFLVIAACHQSASFVTIRAILENGVVPVSDRLLKSTKKLFANVVSGNVDRRDVCSIGRDFQSHVRMPNERDVTNQAPERACKKKRARRQ